MAAWSRFAVCWADTHRVVAGFNPAVAALNCKNRGGQELDDLPFFNHAIAMESQGKAKSVLTVGLLALLDRTDQSVVEGDFAGWNQDAGPRTQDPGRRTQLLLLRFASFFWHGLARY